MGTLRRTASLRLKNSQGFTIVEIAVSLVIVTMAIALVAGLGQQVMDLARRSKQTAAVIELRSKGNAITRNLDSWLGKLRSSPHTGAIFAACIPDPSAATSIFDCPAVDAGLLNNDPELKRIAGTQLHASSVSIVDMMGDKLAGSVDAPIFYDLEGRICETNCAFKATSYMLRSNPLLDSNPGNVRFVVKLEAQSNGQRQTPVRTQYLTIDVGSEWQQATGFCPTGSIKVGYLASGRPNCINPTKSCAAGTIHLGLDTNANPICKTPPSTCASTGGNVVINAAGDDLVCAASTPCNSGKIFLGYYAGTGVPMCSGLDASCPNGQVQIGITQSGANIEAQCKTLPSCQDSQKLSYDGSQFVCQNASVAYSCGEKEVVVGINEDGSLKCMPEERSLASTNLDCPSGKYVSGLLPDGTVKCENLPLSINNGGSNSNGQNANNGSNASSASNASNPSSGATSSGSTPPSTGGTLTLGNGDSTNWHCLHDINIKEECGDSDGCTIQFFLQVIGYYDEVRTYQVPMYLEEKNFSNNTYEGTYGHTYAEGQFILGVKSRYETISGPWGWAYVLNYKHAYCPGQNGTHGTPYSDPHTVSILVHPNVKAKVIFKD